jgi:hypothetical protein
MRVRKGMPHFRAGKTGIVVMGELKGRCPMIGTAITLITIGYFMNKC